MGGNTGGVKEDPNGIPADSHIDRLAGQVIRHGILVDPISD